MAWPSGARRLTVTDFLFRPITGHQGDSPCGRLRPHWRIGSPVPGSSTLITSAPKSARICPQNGPAISVPSSMTTRSARGPLGWGGASDIAPVGAG